MNAKYAAIRIFHKPNAKPAAQIVRRALAPQEMQAPDKIHTPVLLAEVLDALQPKPGGKYLDGTLGLGGHSAAIMKRTEGQALLCGLDRDGQALEFAGKSLKTWASNCHLFNLPYAEFETALDELCWDKLDGAMLDLGVSSLQLDFAERGFSLHAEGPLDMRMDQGNLPQAGKSTTRPQTHASAASMVNTADFESLRRIIAEYGEDPQASAIARAIINWRKHTPITTTTQLAEIVSQTYPPKWRATARNHPATRTFQAIRMAVNNELEQLDEFLDKILKRLAPGARLAIISFHSLEDRRVKQRFRQWSMDCICPPHKLRCTCNHQAEIAQITHKPLTPSSAELQRNPRSASAKLRVAERMAASWPTQNNQPGGLPS